MLCPMQGWGVGGGGQLDRLTRGMVTGLLQFSLTANHGFGTSTGCAPLARRLDVFLHSGPIETSLDQGNSPHHPLVSSYTVMIACFEDL